MNIKNEGYKKIVAITLLFFVMVFSFIFTCMIVDAINNTKTMPSLENINNENAIENAVDNEPDKSTIYQKNGKEVYLGGIPIGIKLGSKGVLVTGFNNLLTDGGKVNPFKDSLVNIGDVLYSVDGQVVKCVDDVVKAVNNAKNDEIELIFSKYNQDIVLKTKIYDDKVSGKKKLGLMVKDEVLGIGTLTFVDYNKRFGALGHHIIDSETGANKQLNVGNIYNSTILGQTKGEVGKAGHLNGVILDKKQIGTVEKNTNIGLYGEASDAIINGLNKIEVGSRDEIKLGNAQIFSSIIGNKPKLYDIEIIKLTKQNSPAERGMIVRVVDKELIDKTGGIVQGMSGSPIIQNGKLVGALTHVFLNDAKKGYGVYIDWMLNN